MVEASERSITELMRALTAAMCVSVADLRYTNGHWVVMVPRGNIMSMVPGPQHNTPEEALLYCLQRWVDLSPERPFLL